MYRYRVRDTSTERDARVCPRVIPGRSDLERQHPKARAHATARHRCIGTRANCRILPE